MEKYIKDLAKDVIYNNPAVFPKNSISLNSVMWNDFKISSIFDIDRGKNINKGQQTYGNIAYVSSTKENNGISNFIAKPPNYNCYKNTITLNNNGSIGYCFYHPYEFLPSSDCTVLNIKNTTLNKFIFIFLKPIIEKFSKEKYNYGRKISNNKLLNEVIVLPVDTNNQPNWQFMEDYVKSLPYSNSI